MHNEHLSKLEKAMDNLESKKIIDEHYFNYKAAYKRLRKSNFEDDKKFIEVCCRYHLYKPGSK